MINLEGAVEPSAAQALIADRDYRGQLMVAAEISTHPFKLGALQSIIEPQITSIGKRLGVDVDQETGLPLNVFTDGVDSKRMLAAYNRHFSTAGKLLVMQFDLTRRAPEVGAEYIIPAEGQERLVVADRVTYMRRDHPKGYKRLGRSAPGSVKRTENPFFVKAEATADPIQVSGKSILRASIRGGRGGTV